MGSGATSAEASASRIPEGDGALRGGGIVFGVLAVGLVLGLAVGMFAVGGVAALRVPELLETGEPFIVSAAYDSGTGGTLYAPVSGLPFRHNNYNPLVQLVAAPILARTGPSYVPMRAMTLAAALLLGLALAWVVRTEGGGRVGAAVAFGLPLSCGFVFPWLCLGRVDVVATLLSTLAVVWAFRRRDGSSAERAPWILLAVLAFAAKQTAISGAGAILLYAVLRRRWREAFIHGAAYVIGVAIVIAIAELTTDGEYWRHAIAYNAEHDRGPFWPETLPPKEMLFAFGPGLLALAGLALLAARRARTPWLVWTLVAFPCAFFFVRKSGSHVTYLLESVAALSVVAALAFADALGRLRASGARSKAAFALGLLVVAALFLPGLHRHQWVQLRHLRWLATRPDPVPAEVRARLAAADAPCLLTAKLGSLAVEAGKPAIFDIADFVRLSDLGLWNAADSLVPLVRARRFPLIGIAEFPEGHPAARHFSAARIPGLLPAIEASYRRLDARLDDPKSRQWGSFWVPKD